MATTTFKDQAFQALSNVIDPELGVDLVDLGLIYDAQLTDEGVAEITMTLTIAGCPLTDWLAGAIHDELIKLPGVKEIEIEITFEPLWNEDMMSREAKMQLGLYR
ncbi:metal-sulfur cluster assembly factor [Lactiplantibacillus fabifermentans]|uniref:N-6 adenine-specific DNA methylase YitW n=2 Tax=Lactiplantibacillus fabifermentans TaxID=483011 RepID=A0A0R2NS53_9LACO|nr:metal-sulfur cluster assembly factor [Lactiplantibacillus fabifermentans]ETY73068.1 aromatic ring hydroxylating protein [Lactiplantibacillus fabifermentans T30PCM01]KRO28516.1 N-6 adenine-specific DNA methylase YitW [Lactiplantibacillus fabifermentans DSM 21115]